MHNSQFQPSLTCVWLLQFYFCQQKEACLGGRNSTCATGYQGVICGYCQLGYQQTEAGCKPCNRGGGGGIQPVGYIIIGVAAVVLVVGIAVAAYWEFFGGAQAAVDTSTEELFEMLDQDGNQVVDAQELSALAELYLDEICDDAGKAAARACMEVASPRS